MKEKYTIALNHSKKTYTIRVYNGRKLAAKYRTNPQGPAFMENWTEGDIKAFLKKSCDYFVIK